MAHPLEKNDVSRFGLLCVHGQILVHDRPQLTRPNSRNTSAHNAAKSHTDFVHDRLSFHDRTSQYPRGAMKLGTYLPLLNL
jgi:hypothetical protein